MNSTLTSCFCAVIASASALAPAHAMDKENELFQGNRKGAMTVTVTNLTHATWLAPILVALHPTGYSGFTEGQPATAELQAVAEIGDIGPLADSLPDGSLIVRNPAGGPLKPGGTVTARLPLSKDFANRRLSVFAMLVPTNDGFIGLNAIDIPDKPGTYTYTLAAYDAGTEANNEAAAAAAGINQPGMGLPPFLNDANGNAAAGIYPDAPGFAAAAAEGYVHVHRGIVGGPAGGESALEQSTYRWLNPVVRVTVTVK